jgi:hypothetical protein
MGIFDWLFRPSTSTSTSTTSLPKWVEDAGKTNYTLASQIAQRPRQTNPYPRIAPFSGDQSTAMSTLRSSTPRALTLPEGGYRPPRLIDNIPGEGGAGSVKDYENPYVEDVINRGIGKMREATDMGQQRINNQAHMSESFGDARHGIDAGQLEREFQKEVGDFSAEQYGKAYDTAQTMRDADIERLMRSQDLDRADQSDLMTWIDAMFRSGGHQQEKTQESLDLLDKDFQDQFNYPTEMLDILTAALTGTPASKTTTETKPGPSNAASILSTIGSIFGALL